MMKAQREERRHPLGEETPGGYAEEGLRGGRLYSTGIAPLEQDLIIQEAGPTPLATLESTFR